MAASTTSNAVVSFGVFEADLRSGELRKCGVKVRIQELPFQALKLLLTHPNEVLTREDLRHALWPDHVFVDFDRGVISTINRLRETLGDSAENPTFVETVGRRGYRWIAALHVPESPPELLAPAVQVPAGEVRQVTIATGPFRWMYFSFGALVLVLLASMFLPRHRSPRPAAQERVSAEVGSGGLRPAANREAQEFYRKGRYYWEKRTPESLNIAVDSFMQAIVHDPAYAPAYVGLADCYNLLREYTMMPASEAYPRALAAVSKAVELDPHSSEAHASLAFVSFYGMWNVATADHEFRRALELNPNNAVAHHWYATYLACLRRYPESLAEIERAQALDPASKSILADKGSLLFSAGRTKEALELLRQMEESEPDFISPHRYLKTIYLLTGDYSRYLAEARMEATLRHDRATLAIANATEKAFAAGGKQRLLEVLSLHQKRLYDQGLFSPLVLAETNAIQGHKREALAYLRAAYDARADGIEQIESDRAFDNLHDEAAFRKLLSDIGLPPLA